MNDPLQHHLADALKDQAPESTEAKPGAPPPGAGDTPEVVAEQTRRGPEDHDDKRSRDDRLVNIGRGHQTHG